MNDPEPTTPASTPKTEAELERERLLNTATGQPEASEFDYIIVGSGAGGGPLACRLAQHGKRVLLLEAGQDPATAKSVDFPKAEVGEITRIPGYHAAATEDQEMSWQFSVRHYADIKRQQEDHKYTLSSTYPNPPGEVPPERSIEHDPDGTGGIFYPRSSGLGGCTGHHAMIVVAPNAKDWDHIADLTGDDSWRATNMQGYFAKMERCLYPKNYDTFFRKILGKLYVVWQKLALTLNPRDVLDVGGHGSRGWQPTSLVDPNLVTGIVEKDRTFAKVLLKSGLAVVERTKGFSRFIKRVLHTAGVVRPLDPNDRNTRRLTPQGLFLTPIGTESGGAEDTTGKGLLGRRVGVREFILKTQTEHPDRLVIVKGVHITRVLFKLVNGVPRAVGVRAVQGDHLYQASPLSAQAQAGEKISYFTKGEVILCGGSFNTPQMLMLSGIGDAAVLNPSSVSPPVIAPVSKSSKATKGAKAKNGAPAGSVVNPPLPPISPGVCVLRGTDDQPLLDASKQRIVVNLPGVGKNLQDRYEVGVVSEAMEEFETLKTVSFEPGDPSDRARRQWYDHENGLYAINGGTLVILQRTAQAEGPESDVFTFGAPAAFRGYYWGWSKELFKPTKGALHQQKNLWTWVILKAYTRNNGGTVTLRSDNPFATPVICFNSFDAHPDSEWQKDVRALEEAVETVRQVNAKAGQFKREIQPAGYLEEKNRERRVKGDKEWSIGDWIKNEAWGHHACGTCRIGSDAWQSNPANLVDTGAVLDSKFRVHGVEGLRVVDASVFPKIPGYFILAPLLMVSEKAADTILSDSSVYPKEFEEREAAAILKRRAKADPQGERAKARALAREEALKQQAATAAVAGAATPLNPQAATTTATGTAKPPTRPAGSLPEDTVGLALSGGGIRSATFCLGVLQTLASKNRLRDVDLLSSVSGGGFMASFLGRLFTRSSVKQTSDPVGRVQETLQDTRSGPMWWLRTHANYILFSGADDVRQSLAILFRNIFTIYLILGALFFMLLGGLAGLTQCVCLPFFFRDPLVLPVGTGIPISPWWWMPAAALALGILPSALGFWLAPKVGSYRTHPFFALTGWLVLLAGATWALVLPNGFAVALGGIGVLILSWISQESARWGAPKDANRKPKIERVGTLVRNRLSRSLGVFLNIFALLLIWVVLDTLARWTVAGKLSDIFMTIAAGLAPLMPVLHTIVRKTTTVMEGDKSKAKTSSFGSISNWIGFVLVLFLLFALDLVAHRVFLASCLWGWWAVVVCFFFSLAVGRGFDFLNLSSLHNAYASRLIRTFLGASNEARVYTTDTETTQDVELSHPEDDVPLHRYHPENQGGPLHLINVCVNDNVDYASDRQIPDRKGQPMCVGPVGVNVARTFSSLWEPLTYVPVWTRRRLVLEGEDETAFGRDGSTEDRPKTALRPILTDGDPNAFHVFAYRDTGVVVDANGRPVSAPTPPPAPVESLTLGAWAAISGAAVSTGSGRDTTASSALLMGLTNVRLGYWWNSGLRSEDRPGHYPPSLWQRIKKLPRSLFRMQSMLLEEWRARFHGPSRWYWNLSDGGHFDVSGVYELIRRRVPFMVEVDCGADPHYQFSDLAVLTRLARTDFEAEIDWIDPTVHRNFSPEVLEWVELSALGTIEEIKRNTGKQAALATVTYRDGTVCWLLWIKPALGGPLSEDVRNYQKVNPIFPQDPVIDQFFDGAQWESYRKLGADIAARVIKSSN